MFAEGFRSRKHFSSFNQYLELYMFSEHENIHKSSGKTLHWHTDSLFMIRWSCLNIISYVSILYSHIIHVTRYNGFILTTVNCFNIHITKYRENQTTEIHKSFFLFHFRHKLVIGILYVCALFEYFISKLFCSEPKPV